MSTEDKTIAGLVISAQEFSRVMEGLDDYINGRILIANDDCPYSFCGYCDDPFEDNPNGCVDNTPDCSKYRRFFREDIESILRGEPNDRVLDAISYLYKESTEKPEVSVHD